MKAYGAEAVQETYHTLSGQWWGGRDLCTTTCSENMKSCNTSYGLTFYASVESTFCDKHILFVHFLVLWFITVLI
jgi:hypothetical protein